MDFNISVQDVICCDFCMIFVVQMYCDICFINLCIVCVGEYMVFDDFFDYKVVKFRFMNFNFFYFGCVFYDKELCVMYCNYCEFLVCFFCIITDQYLGYKLFKVL